MVFASSQCCFGPLAFGHILRCAEHPDWLPMLIADNIPPSMYNPLFPIRPKDTVVKTEWLQSLDRAFDDVSDQGSILCVNKFRDKLLIGRIKCVRVNPEDSIKFVRPTQGLTL